MGPPTVNFVLVVVLGLLASLPAGPLMVHAEGNSEVPDEDTATTPRMPSVDNLCSPLQRRQDLLENRMNERVNGLDTRLSTQLNELHAQLNGLDTRLSTRQSEVNSRFNRMDSRFDGIETAISDMKGFLQERMNAINEKVEWALTDIKPRRDVGTTQPDTNPVNEPQVYRGCEDALSRGQNTSGVYTITPDHDESFSVYCDQRIDGGGWTVFQSRHNGEVDFYNDWNTFKAGFGEFNTEFWLGNDKIHKLTKQHNMQLKVELTSPAGEVQYADYRQFLIDDEAHQYTLTVTGYTGGSPPGDAMVYHNGQKFSTKDEDNDRSQAFCATRYKGAWWHNACHHANLNGLYGGTGYKGMRWEQWKGYLSMKATRMLMRRRP